MNKKPMQLVGRDHPVLHTPAEPVTDIDQELWLLVMRMRATLIARGGIALAAPQVGRPLRLIVTAYDDVALNPSIETHGKATPWVEGCLSLPGRWYEVPRFDKVTLTATSLGGEEIVTGVQGDYARLWQHEIDHLDGVLIAERWPEVRQPKAAG